MTRTIITFGLNTFTMKGAEEMKEDKMVKSEMFGGLKPCPICNSENLGAEQAPLGAAYQIGCVDCGYCGPMTDLSSGNAGMAWNTQGEIERLYQNLDALLDKALELRDKEDGPTAEWWGLNDAAEGIGRAIHDLHYHILSPPEYPDEAQIEDEEATAEMDALGEKLMELEAFPT